MNHSILHAWQCPCGTRNAPDLPACHRCGCPANQGEPVYLEGPPAKRQPWLNTPQGLAFSGLLALGAVLLRVLAGLPVDAFFALVGLIGAGFIVAAGVLQVLRR
jgi:hypothetical protein